jgi:hypothetical protein
MDGLNDPSLDREIESLLAVEPSPEFVARVRARVANEPAPGGWRASWLLAIAGAVAVVIAAVIAWPSGELATSADPQVLSPSVADAIETVTPLGPFAPVHPVRRPPAIARVAVAPASPDRVIDIDLPEVVIADNEVKTFVALVASVRQQRFDVSVPAAPDSDTRLEVKVLPPVEPLEIEPIVKLATLQAEGDRP